MRQVLLTILLLIIYNNAFTQEGGKSFEGVLIYFIGVKSKAPYMHSPIAENYGDTLIHYQRANGDFRRDFVNSGKDGMDYYFYKKKENRLYVKYNNSDTIISEDCGNRYYQLISKEKGDSKGNVLGYKCQYVSYVLQHPESTFSFKLTYHYNGHPYIDPELYFSYEEMFMGDFMIESKSPYAVFEQDYGDYTIGYMMLDYKQKKVSRKLFELPKGLPVKITH